MSRRFTDGYFALGLVLGAAVTIVLALAVSDYGSGCYLTDGNSYGDKGQGTQPDKRCWLIPFFIYGEDTLAQWAMALLSLAAVYLLWETLKASRQTLSATRDMARDTRKIGEAQVAAHLSVATSRVTFVSSESDGQKLGMFSFKFEIANHGQTTAFNTSAFVWVFGAKKREMWMAAKPSDLDPGQRGSMKLWQQFDFAETPKLEEGGGLRLTVRYDTVFTQALTKRKAVIRHFDFQIVKNINGSHTLIRGDYRGNNSD